MNKSAWCILGVTVAACGVLDVTVSEVATRPHALEATGARNQAFAEAEARYRVPREVLMTLAYLQGRLEAAGDTAQRPMDLSLPPEEQADPHFVPHRFGVMYLSAEQVARAADLTGLSDEAVRRDVGANVMAAAALLALDFDGSQPLDWTTLTPLESAVTRLHELEESPLAAKLAHQELLRALRTGFDITTADGERVALRGFGEPLEVAQQRLGAGEYPSVQWIRSPNFSSRNGYPVRFVVIHDMEGFMPGAISVFQNPARQSAAHYLLRASDGHIVQMVNEADNAWHCGNGWYNRNSIGIEHEGFAGRPNGGGYYNETQYRASAALVAAICARYGIPVDRAHIFGHGNVPSSGSGGICSDAMANAAQCGGSSHHWDPGPEWNWPHYLDLIAAALRQPPPQPLPPPTPPSCGALASGAQLAPGAGLRSCNGAVTFVHQGDGNVVLYDNRTGQPLWNTNTQGQSTQTLAMQADGNLVLYGAGPRWWSGTHGNAGAILVVQDDGNVVVYGAGFAPLWQTGTRVSAPPPPPPPPPPGCGHLAAGAQLLPGQSVDSCNGRFTLAHQGDGNVVLYEGARPLWFTGTHGRSTGTFAMQLDGNLVLYSAGGSAMWNSRTHGNGGAWLAVQDDGNVVIYSSSGTPLWFTGTNP